MIMRLAKYLSNSGIASRRQAEVLISSGKVKVNGEIVKTLGTSIDSEQDQIFYNNKLVKSDDKVYYLLNKPVGYICSNFDAHNRQNVLTLVPKSPRVYPVGRLDKDSQGLLLLTNDGDLTYELTHPKFAVKKEYLVELDKEILAKDLLKLKSGIRLTEGVAKADQVKKISPYKIQITIHQGWNRQLRRMLQALNYKVVSLTRVKEGDLALGNLALGKYKILNIKDFK